MWVLTQFGRVFTADGFRPWGTGDGFRAWGSTPVRYEDRGQAELARRILLDGDGVVEIEADASSATRTA